MRNFWAFTDYPTNGNTGRSPMRRVEILGYDDNKYCFVRDHALDEFSTIKKGYLYRNRRKVSYGHESLSRRYSREDYFQMLAEVDEINAPKRY